MDEFERFCVENDENLMTFYFEECLCATKVSESWIWIKDTLEFPSVIFSSKTAESKVSSKQYIYDIFLQ